MHSGVGALRIDALQAVVEARAAGKGIEFRIERNEAAKRTLFPQNYPAQGM